MKYCPYCGSKLLNPQVSFCAECGKPLSTETQDVSAGHEKKQEHNEHRRKHMKKAKVKSRQKEQSVAADSEMKVEKTKEDDYDGYYDDGYTGTNFDRPKLQEMLAMVRSGKITCIIVKDLSRFGRNYLEVGDYLEHIFPFLNVRFIAVNDHYDSNSYIGTTGGIDVAFRNLIYQRYSQDLSEKVKSAMHMKMAKGKYITNCPYGYMKKPGVKHEMIPDPAAAPIVRKIFLAAIEGKKSTEIAAMLNQKDVPMPMVYKRLSRKDMHNDAMWSHQAIIRIIKDYKYTGAMVNFKCKMKQFGFRHSENAGQMNGWW